MNCKVFFLFSLSIFFFILDFYREGKYDEALINKKSYDLPAVPIFATQRVPPTTRHVSTGSGNGGTANIRPGFDSVSNPLPFIVMRVEAPF